MGEGKMKLYEKLLEIQRQVDAIVKDSENKSDKYLYVSNDAIVDAIRPLMNVYGILLIPEVRKANLLEGVTRSGTTRYLCEVYYDMIWHDVESGEELHIQSYAAGTDLAGEKFVGKAATYNEKIFLLKFFHIPTPKDDPDSDGKTKNGEKSQKGTQAEAETILYQRESVRQMLDELYGGDVEKTKAAVVSLTKNDARQYAGVDSVDAITDMQVKVVYGKLKGIYQKRTGKEFAFNPNGKEVAADAD